MRALLKAVGSADFVERIQASMQEIANRRELFCHAPHGGPAPSAREDVPAVRSGELKDCDVGEGCLPGGSAEGIQVTARHRRRKC